MRTAHDAVRAAALFLFVATAFSVGGLSAAAAPVDEPWVDAMLARGFFSPVNRKPLFRDELMDDRNYYPDDYLQKLRACGVNGIWIVARLRHLASTSFAPADPDRDRRFAKLRRVVETCGRYGIKVWLLGIEPHREREDDPLYRAHPEMFSPIPWAEHVMCPCRAETRDYLEAAMKDIFTKVPGLGGWINISHGERKTTCLGFLDPVEPRPLGCPACASRRPWELHAQVVEAMSRGIRAANPSARLISWLYHPDGDERRADWVVELARHVPEGVTLQYNFESGVAETFRGRRLVAGDYWHSRVGPAAPFAAVASAAVASGARLSAKIQTSNGHETADVPTVPAPGILYRKFKAMKAAGVRDVMLSWYPGSYPGVMMTAAGMLAREDFSDGEEAFLRRLAQRTWGNADAATAVALWQRFERAYAQYPLSLLMQYYGPFGSGVSWPLHAFVDLKPLPRTWRSDDAVDGDTIGECLDNHTLEEVCEIAASMAAELQSTPATLVALRTRHAADRARVEELGCYEALVTLFASAADIFSFYLDRRVAVTTSRAGGDRATCLAAVRRMTDVCAREKTRTRRMIGLCRDDPWLGWHSEAECRLFDPEMLHARLVGLDKTLADLETIAAELKAGKPYPLSALERTAPVWTATRTANGDIRIEGESHSEHQVNVYTMDLCGTTLAKGYSARPEKGRFAVTIPASDIPADPALKPAWLFIRQGYWLWPEGPSPKGRLLQRSLQGDRFGRLEVREP